MRCPSHFHALLLLIGALTLPPAIAFADPSVADKETARALILDGRKKLGEKDYAGARKAFQAAHEIMGVTTTGLDLAKALDGLGLLIEARATALDVSRIPQKPSEPQAFTDARAAAVTLAEQLAGRIPALVISVKGIDAKATPSITVDGNALSPSMLTLPRKINPGAHIIIASAPGYATERRDVTLKEGETTPVEITLASPGAAKPAPDKPLPSPRPAVTAATPLPSSTAAPPAPPSSPTAPPEPVPPTGNPTSGQRIAGFAVGGVGLISVVVGAAFGVKAMSKDSASKADGRCDAQSFCDPAGKELRLASFQAATISTVGFVVGGIALAGGTVLVLTAPSQHPAASVALGPGSIFMTGRW